MITGFLCVPVFKFIVPKINSIGVYFDTLDVMLPSVLLAMLAGYSASTYKKETNYLSELNVIGASIIVLSHFPLSEFDKAILIVIVKGTESTMPTGPNTHPQKSRETKTTKVERPKPFPSILGSSILPILILITRYPAAERRAVIRPCLLYTSPSPRD